MIEVRHATRRRSGRPRRGLLAPAAVLGAALAGCTVGPDFVPPKQSTPETWSGLNPDVTNGTPSKPVAGAPDIVRWWDTFGDSTLTDLVARATTSNLTLEQARAVVREARALRVIAGSAEYPTVTASGAATRSRGAVETSNGTIGNTRNLFRAGFDASWELDIFGGIRRGVEAADAGVESSIENERDVMITLSAEVATTYVQLRAAQRQLVIARSNLETQTETLELTRERLDAGFVGALDVANARAQVAATTSFIPTLEASERSSIYALGVLVGEDPAALLAELSQDGPIPTAPQSVPVGLPSELLERRPDIRRAQADLHVATARIGVATADLYPRFSLTAALGLQGGTQSALSTLANRFWAAGGAVTWPVFEGGRIQGNIDLQKASADESLSIYKQTVLTALQDVETALVTFSKEQQRRTSLRESVEANREAVAISTELYTAGKTDFLNVLTAQRQQFAAEDALSQSERNIATDLVALYKALGGGWNPEADGVQEPNP